MSELSWIAVGVGLAAVCGGGIAAWRPERVRENLLAFPRSVWPGRILAAVALGWAAVELSQMHLGFFDAWKPGLVWLTPLAVVACIVYLDELLSPRALGGVLLLAAGPVLRVARWHPSDWRLVMTSLAYIWIGIGMLFLLAPWWFRRIVLWSTSSRSAIRCCAALKLLAGAGLVGLGLWVY